MSVPNLTRRGLGASVAAAALIGLGKPAGAQDTSSPRRRDAEWLNATKAYGAERQRLLSLVAKGDENGPFATDWASLKAAYKTPDWYADSKFGIFVHYGVYAVPAFGNEWYPCDMYDKTTPVYAHHVKTYGSQDKFGYKDFIPQFTADKFDAEDWAAVFKAAGARYVVPVAEHHDGFSMYDSHLSDWTAVKMGPKRDIVAAVRKAVLANGLHFGLSSHRAEHDFYYDQGRNIPSDVGDPSLAGFYGPAQTHLQGADGQDLFGDYTYVSQAYLDDWLARQVELVDRYQPELVYFDWWIGQPSFRQTLPKFLAYYYNASRKNGAQGVVNYKVGEFMKGTGVLDIERGQAPGIREDVWQTCTSISNISWGYIDNDTYKTAGEIIHLLCDVVSKNGNLLLNVGPHADGSLPAAARDTLLKVGAWLSVNGEAIYGSRPWTIFGEGPTQPPTGAFNEAAAQPYTAQDLRFTRRGDKLYVIAMGWPATGQVDIRAILPDHKVSKVTLLGEAGAIPFNQDHNGLHLNLPSKPFDADAYVYSIEGFRG